MQIIISVCVIIITVVFVVLVFDIMNTLKTVRHTCQTLDTLAKNINERVDDLKPALSGLRTLSEFSNSIVGKAIDKISSFFKKDEWL